MPAERLGQWYRRFIDTRSSDSAERSLRTAIDSKADLGAIEQMMVTAITDHVFIDEGHSLDFTNKAFEALELLGDECAATVLPTLVAGTAGAQRSEEFSEWRYPHDPSVHVSGVPPGSAWNDRRGGNRGEGFATFA